MTESKPAAPIIPNDSYLAPLTYWRNDRSGALVFLMFNIVLGALGIYAPIGISALTDGKVGEAAEFTLNSGAVYLFAIPFLAACAGYAFETMVEDRQSLTRQRKVLLTCISVPVLIFCVILLTVQISPGVKVQTLNHVAQCVLSFFAVALGIYIYCMVKNDLGKSIADDFNKGAKTLQERADNASAPQPGDFQ